LTWWAGRQTILPLAKFRAKKMPLANFLYDFLRNFWRGGLSLLREITVF
jgi:hypothetical protein